MMLPAMHTRLGELLADRALLGLSDSESAELRALLRDEPGVDEWALERAATALFVGLSAIEIEAPPVAVRERLDVAAGDWASARRPAPQGRSGGTEAPPEVVSRVGRASSAFAWMAAAACLALALIAWWPRRAPVASEQAAIALAESQPDALHLAWTPGPDEVGRSVTGEVVWSDRAQSGYMEFRDLPALDPERWQYQLWIVDPARDKHPVDGGVFDAPARGGVVRVPIRAKLRVDKPVAFVVTVEQPGGVVVSSQERVALVAAAAR